MSAPVTVSITRTISPGHHDEMVAWIRAGSALADPLRRVPRLGLGAPVDASRRSGTCSTASPTTVARDWEASPQREWWLGAAQGLVGESSIERRTGIEGWFDPPATYDVEDLRPPAPAPPRWKQASVIFLVFFPLSVLANWVAGHTVAGLPLVLRVLRTSCS